MGTHPKTTLARSLYATIVNQVWEYFITRLTLRPYYFALAYLTALLSYTLVTALLVQYKEINNTVDNDGY